MMCTPHHVSDSLVDIACIPGAGQLLITHHVGGQPVQKKVELTEAGFPLLLCNRNGLRPWHISTIAIHRWLTGCFK